MQPYQAVASGSVLLCGAAAEAARNQRPVASAVRSFLRMGSGKAASTATSAKREPLVQASAKGSASAAAKAAAEAAERRNNPSSRAQQVSPPAKVALAAFGLYQSSRIDLDAIRCTISSLRAAGHTLCNFKHQDTAYLRHTCNCNVFTDVGLHFNICLPLSMGGR